MEKVKQLLFKEGTDAAEHLDEALGEQDLTRFIRSIIGLDAKAARALVPYFINRDGINAEQMNFINTLINSLTVNGAISAEMLFERPFTDINHNGV